MPIAKIFTVGRIANPTYFGCGGSRAIVLLRENYADREDFAAISAVGRVCNVTVTLHTHIWVCSVTCILVAACRAMNFAL